MRALGFVVAVLGGERRLFWLDDQYPSPTSFLEIYLTLKFCKILEYNVFRRSQM
jgi:hypothetical protein